MDFSLDFLGKETSEGLYRRTRQFPKVEDYNVDSTIGSNRLVYAPAAMRFAFALMAGMIPSCALH